MHKVLLITSLFGILSCKNTGSSITFNYDQAEKPLVILSEDSKSEHNLDSCVRFYLIRNSARVKKPMPIRFSANKSEDNKHVYEVTPYYNLSPGETYAVFVDWHGKHRSDTFTIPPKQNSGPVSVSTFPETDIIPSNILQFHLSFSRPMVADIQAFERIEVQSIDGTSIDQPWREKADWSSDGLHLALMIHPGRVKRGITYLNDDGQLFTPGETYRLVLKQPLMAIEGAEVTPRTLKEFTVRNAEDDLPQLVSHEASTPSEVLLRFSEGMDYGTIKHGVVLKDSANNRLPFKLISINDSLWKFVTPNNLDEPRSIEIKAIVSDYAANRMDRPFETRTLSEIRLDKSRTVIIDDSVVLP